MKPPLRRALIAALAVGAVSIGRDAPARPIPPGRPPAVELVESVPIETDLGRPGHRSTAEVWLEMIAGARERIDLEHFYLSAWPGEPLDPVLDAIGAAAQRGVRVRLLLDARMRGTYPQPAESLGTIRGIEVRWIAMGPIAGGVQHAKCMLIDDRECFVGSQNLDWRALKHIHELGVRVRDARLTAAFREVFEMDWEAAGEQQTGRDSTAAEVRARRAGRSSRPYPIAIARSPGDTIPVWPSWSPRGFIPDSTRWDLDAIVGLLDRARDEIVLQLLSYSPRPRDGRDDPLDAALRRAAARGVKVRMLISDWQAGGRGMEALQDLARVPNLEARLRVVPEWTEGYIPYARVVHAKYVVVDRRWIWIGTSNWEPGYFHGSRNLGLTILDPPLGRQIRDGFETRWTAAGAEPVVPDSTYAPRIHGMEPPAGARVYGR